MQGNPFQQAEDEFHRLVGQFSAGRITQEQLEAALRALMVQDDQGRWWMLGAKTGQWHVHDGDQWIAAQPPVPNAPPRPIALPEQPALRRVPDVPRVAKTQKRNSLPLVLGGVILILALLAVSALVISNLLEPTTVVIAPYATPSPEALETSPAGTVTASGAVLVRSTPQPLLPSAQYVSRNASLAEAIATLNRAELKFIQDVNASLSLNAPARAVGLAAPAPYAPNFPLLDADLREMAAAGMQVGNLASDLGRATGASDNGSQAAAQIADHYFGIARMGYAIVIESQNMRDDLNKGNANSRTWANRIADYGVRLWNPAVSGGPKSQSPVNPFLAYHPQPATVPTSKFLNSNGATKVKVQLPNPSSAISSWIARAPGALNRSLPIPASAKPLKNPFDADLGQNLTTASGQSDAGTARQVAAARLAQIVPGADPSAGMLDIPLPESSVMTGPELGAAFFMPFYDDGPASAVVKSEQGGDASVVDVIFGVPGGEPKVQSQVIVDSDPKYPVALTLTLTQIVRTNPGDAKPYTAYVTLSWNAPKLVNPNFIISCVGTDPREIAVNSNSGQQVFTAREKVGYYTIDCAASSPDRRVVNLLGSVYLPIDVGGDAEMTEQAHEQDTRWAVMDKTRDAQNTALFKEVEGTMTAEVKLTQANRTGQAVGKEVAGTQTAEFRATVTRIAQLTAQAQKAGTDTAAKQTQQAAAGNVATMNGTMNYTRCEQNGSNCSHETGLVRLTLDFNTGQVTAHASFSGKWRRPSDCVVTERTGSYSTEADFTGTVDKAGALSLTGTGKITTTSDQGVCYCDKSKGTNYCDPGWTKTDGPYAMHMTGTIDRAGGTGKGQLFYQKCMETSCGDWHAGQ